MSSYNKQLTYQHNIKGKVADSADSYVGSRFVDCIASVVCVIHLISEWRLVYNIVDMSVYILWIAFSSNFDFKSARWKNRQIKLL